MVGWLGGWVVGWGKVEIKAKLSPAKAEAWAELGKINNPRSFRHPKEQLPNSLNFINLKFPYLQTVEIKMEVCFSLVKCQSINYLRKMVSYRNWTKAMICCHFKK